MTIFEYLETVSNDYKARIDELSAEYEREEQTDQRYNDELREQRHRERLPEYDAKIKALAEKAQERAQAEIDRMRTRLKEYITSSSDPATMQALSSLIASGVKLTSAEVKAFADGAGYAILRMLEPMGGGQITAPRLDGLQNDINALEGYFKRLEVYRGKMGDTNTAQPRPYGQSGRVASTIQAGQIGHFHDRLSEMEPRWTGILKEG